MTNSVPLQKSVLSSGVSLVVVFIVGLLAGFSVRPLVMPEQAVGEPQMVEVVVTATPDPEAVVAEAAADDEPLPTASLMDMVLSGSRHTLGDQNAPITIVEFSDFKCGYCGRFATESLEQIREEYVETGKVRFVYKHFAILGEQSVRAAEASECASEQDNFWEYHDALFVDTATQRSNLTDERLTEIASEVGLEVGPFVSCLDAGRTRSVVSQETLGAQSLGMRGTPAFLINGMFVSGAQPIEVFQDIIEKELEAVAEG